MLSAALLVLAMTPGALPDSIFSSAFDDPDGCPGGRQVLADIEYAPDCTVNGVDVTDWTHIWGYECGTGGTVPFPGITDAPDADPTILDFGKNTYIAAHIHVPDDLPTNTLGWILHTDYNFGADLIWSISPNCGDFNPANPVCRGVSISGQNIAPWRLGSGALCPLDAGHDYFLNLELRTTGGSRCSAESPSCAVSLPNVVNMP